MQAAFLHPTKILLTADAILDKIDLEMCQFRGIPTTVVIVSILEPELLSARRENVHTPNAVLEFLRSKTLASLGIMGARLRGP